MQSFRGQQFLQHINLLAASESNLIAYTLFPDINLQILQTIYIYYYEIMQMKHRN